VGGHAKARLIPEMSSATEDVLMLVLNSKSMQGFYDAVGNPEYPSCPAIQQFPAISF